MELKTEKTENTLIVYFIGRLDTTNAGEAEEKVNSLMEGENDIVFDLKDLEYLSSAGLRILLLAQKRMLKQGKLTVRNVNEVVGEIFETTGFSQILNIE